MPIAVCQSFYWNEFFSCDLL